MRINAIDGQGASLSVDPDELVCLANVLYFYQKHHAMDGSFTPPNAAFHAVAKQVEIARDLCQYGRLDGHVLGTVIAHEIEVNPDGRLAEKLRKLIPEN